MDQIEYSPRQPQWLQQKHQALGQSQPVGPKDWLAHIAEISQYMLPGRGGTLYGVDDVAQQAIEKLKSIFPRVVQQAERKIPYDIQVGSHPTQLEGTSSLGQRIHPETGARMADITIPGEPQLGKIRALPDDLRFYVDSPAKGGKTQIIPESNREWPSQQTPLSALLDQLLNLMYRSKPQGRPQVPEFDSPGFWTRLDRPVERAINNAPKTPPDRGTPLYQFAKFPDPQVYANESFRTHMTNTLTRGLAEKMLSEQGKVRRPWVLPE